MDGPISPKFLSVKKGELRISVQMNPTKTCTDESSICRNKQCYSCRCILKERSMFFLSMCYLMGLCTGQEVFLSGTDNVFLFSTLHLFGILMTHNELDSKATSTLGHFHFKK